jgi:hypothetical protein
MPTERKIVLLGPQRHSPILDRAVADLGLRGRLAAVTAGWEEREDEDQELSQHLGGRVHNLRVYQRLEQVLQKDPELRRGMQERYDALRKLQELYRLRLQHAIDAARELFRRESGDPLVERMQADAIQDVRRIDAQHLEHVEEVQADYRESYRPDERAGVARERERIREELGGCEGLLIAGGHVAVLLNRIRTFGVLESSGGMPVLAWSAGAMVLCERVVLFHDNPPQGFGNAEVHQAGLGVVSGLVALPHASQRLWLHDPLRVELLARRLAPAACVALDARNRIDRLDGRWITHPGTSWLGRDGRLHPEPEVAEALA